MAFNLLFRGKVGRTGRLGPLVKRGEGRGLVTKEIREIVEGIAATYDEVDRRLAAAGGLSKLLSTYDQLRRELEKVSLQELDRMTGEIKNVIEVLLKIDYELRKIQNLKLVFEPHGSQGG